MPIPIQQWEWFGHPQHFIAAESCMFRLGTRVGDFMISTVGDYYLSEKTAEILGRAERGPEPIGYQRKFETMVFKLKGGGARKPCGCPEFESMSELECVPYNDAPSAQRGHFDVCSRYAEMQCNKVN